MWPDDRRAADRFRHRCGRHSRSELHSVVSVLTGKTAGGPIRSADGYPLRLFLLDPEIGPFCQIAPFLLFILHELAEGVRRAADDLRAQRSDPLYDVLGLKRAVDMFVDKLDARRRRASLGHQAGPANDHETRQA